MTDTRTTQPMSGEEHSQTAGYGACSPEKVVVVPDAMDADTYEDILGQLPELRGPGYPEKQPEFELHPGKSHAARLASRFCGGFLKSVGDEGADEGSYTDAELKLRLDLALNKVYWYANFSKDLWCWTRNSNPVLALCYSHPLHPVSRTERMFITLVHAVFVMMISSMTSRAKECVAAGLNTCAATAVPSSVDDSFCCTSHRILLSGALIHIPAHLGGTIYALVVNTIFAQFMYQLGASCACVQGRRPGVRRFWEFLGHLAMFAVLVAMIVPTVHWLVYDQRHGMLGSTVLHFVINKPLSMLGTTAIQTVVFTLMWRKQRDQDALKEGYQHFFVTASDYQAFALTKAKIASC